MITPTIKNSLVQIMGKGKVHGNGFLVAPGYILTCAHVIRDCGLDPASPSNDLASEVAAKFHWIADMPVVQLELAKSRSGYHFYYQEDGIDLAVLKTLSTPPELAKPLRLSTQIRHAFQAELEPFIPDLGCTRRISAVVDGQDNRHRLVLVPAHERRQWIEAGVSGSAVFSLDGELVEGMVIRDDVLVKQAFAWPAPKIASIIDDVKQETVSPNYRRTPSRPYSDKQIISAFLGNDPMPALDIMPSLAAGDAGVIGDLLKEGYSSKRSEVLRLKLCRQIGPDAIHPLVMAIRKGSWGEKISAAPCFAAFSDGLANDDIYSLLKIRDFDVQRNAISASGYTGYSSDIRWNLVRLAKYDDLHKESHSVSDYSFNKLFPFVIDALVRGFSRSGEFSEVHHLKEFLDFCLERGQKDAIGAVEDAFENVEPAAADTLIETWLPLTDGLYSKLALYAIGRARLRRAAQFAIPFLSDNRQEVARMASLCLGSVCDEVIARGVAEYIGSSTDRFEAGWAVSTLYGQWDGWKLDDKYLDTLLEGFSDIAGQMLVSVAQRDPDKVVHRARRGLVEMDSFYRGASAVALAWARPKDVDDLLSQASDEAATPIECTLIVAAQVLAGRYELGSALHNELCRANWEQFQPFWRYQILTALHLSDARKGYADCWAELSGDNAPRFKSVVSRFAHRADLERAAVVSTISASQTTPSH